MPTATVQRLDATYRSRLAATRDLLVAQIEREYGVLDAEDIRGSFDEFASVAVPRIEAGQATVQTMSAAYIRSLVEEDTEAEEPVVLASMRELAGATSEGQPLADVLDGIKWSILGKIAEGNVPLEAISIGEFYIKSLVDNEITAVADKVIDEQSQALDQITGWEGDVNPDACERCHENNDGVHRLDDPIYRHPGCNCTKIPIHERPGQTIPERQAVQAVVGPEVEDHAAAVRAEAISRERSISEELQGFVEGLASYDDAMRGAVPPEGDDLVGFENRVKSLASTARKIATRMRDEGVDSATAADSVRDALRYTVRTRTENYTSHVAARAEALLRAGYFPTKWKSSWAEGSEYFGLNTFWAAPGTGYQFEIQFHTSESFISKELNHAAYEAQRVLDRTIPQENALWLQLDRQMAERAAAVPRPGETEVLDEVGLLLLEQHARAIALIERAFKTAELHHEVGDITIGQQTTG